MKKYFVLSFALLAALVACNKDQIVPENNDAPAASFTATIAPDTKITFTSDGQANEGFTTKFDGNECVYLWVANTGSANPKDKYTVFYAGTHTDKTSKFNITTNATHTYTVDPAKCPIGFGAFMTSYNCMGPLEDAPFIRFGYNSDGFIKRFDFRVGNGTIDQAKKVQFLFANGSYDAVAYPDLAFSYLTSILKVNVSLPAGSGASTSNTKIYVKGTGLVTAGQLNTTTGALKINESGSKPTFTITPDASVFNGDNLVFYVPVWTGLSGVTIKDATVEVVVGEELYSVELANATGKTVAPGKVYTFKPTTKIAIQKWVDDAAGNITIATGLTESVSDGLTYNSATGQLSWEANTTGKPVRKTITFTSGEKVDITQISVDDFKGNWTFYAKTFKGQNKIGLTANSTGAYSVNFGDPYGGVENLDDEDTGLTLTNNIGIRGLFGNKDAADAAVMNASLRLDRDKKIVEFYLFFDGRSAQSTNTGDANYPYVMFLPEFGGSFIGATYDFCPFPLGSSQNYGYVRMSINPTASKLTYNSNNVWWWGNAGDKNGKVVCGISVNVSKASTPTASDLRGANVLGTSSKYEYIYQANYNGSTEAGFYFSR